MKRLPMLLAAGTLLAVSTAPTLAVAYYPYAPGYYAPYGPRYYYPRYYYPYPPPFARPLYPYAYYAPPPVPYVPRYAQAAPPPLPPKREAAPPPPAPERLDRITLSATELFAFDEATLVSPQPKLDEIARAMIENPKIGNLTITGYTDRLGTQAYNLKLSERRAEVVKGYLVTKGVAASRLTVVGKGEANPVVQCHDKDREALIQCLEPNRRVVVG